MVSHNGVIGLPVLNFRRTSVIKRSSAELNAAAAFAEGSTLSIVSQGGILSVSVVVDGLKT